jgi:anaerobic magnesium-protoporphyrin IX monomethyl ester cyclase
VKVLLVDPAGASYGLSPALAIIGAFLKSEGIEVKGLDLNNLHISLAEEVAQQKISKFQPDLIGYSILYTNYRWLQNHLKRLRQYFSGPVMVGGPQVILEGKDLFASMPEVDIACVGEGEYAIWEVVKCLERGRSLQEVHGILFRSGDQLVETPARRPVENLDELPFPDFEIFETRDLPYYPILTSRGCPFRCKYCFRSVKGDWRPRSPDNVVAEMEHAITTYRFNQMVIHDDSFNVDLKRVLKICDLMMEREIRIPWKCAGIRANRVTDEVCKRMKAAGCVGVAVGIESLDPEVFESIDKRESLPSILEGINILRRNGLKVVGYFIIGLPGDNYQKTMETFKKAKKIVDEQSWTLLLPIPGTPLWEELHQNPHVRWLHDYRDIDMTWHSRLSEMKTAFETPEYSAKGKLFAYHKINIHLGLPKYKVYSSRVRTLLGVAWLIARHGPVRGSLHIIRRLPWVLRKVCSGRIPLSEKDLALVLEK